MFSFENQYIAEFWFIYVMNKLIVLSNDDGLSLKEGSVRLQEKEAKDGEMTGWEVETEITSVKLISLSDVEKMTDEEIKSFGFNTNVRIFLLMISSVFFIISFNLNSFIEPTKTKSISPESIPFA